MRTFSGIKPTGEATLGTLLGAVKNWLEYQGTDSYYCIVDLHAITVPQDPSVLRSRVLELAATFLAVGLDRDVNNIFVQSRVSEHSELAWILQCMCSFGELRRMTQFKDQQSKGKTVSVGLFTYPTLMAADILLYNTEVVPVGEDQRQHVELTRDIAQRFNAKYGDIFTIPSVLIKKAGARIRDLQDPTVKMSKSEDSSGTILLTDELSAIKKKIMRAVTDSEPELAYDPINRPGVSNLITIYAAIMNTPPENCVHLFTSYKDLKQAVATEVCNYLAPIKERYEALMADPAVLYSVLERGEKVARNSAQVTLERVKNVIGLS